MTVTGNRKILIVGNGPSARQIAEFGFHRIPKDFDTFGMGAAYRYYYCIDWWPTYYAWCDQKVVHSHRDALTELIHDQQVSTRRFYFSLPITDHSRFELVPHASTGDFCCLKAAELGYEEIYLIGIEGHYLERIPQSREMTEEEIEEFHINAPEIDRKRLEDIRIISVNSMVSDNYFFSWYQSVGDIYSLPQADKHRERWQVAIAPIRGEGTRVINLSKRSRLKGLAQGDFDDVMAAGRAEPPALFDESRANAGRGGNTVLIAFPTMRTDEEYKSWKIFCEILRARGYNPVILSSYVMILEKNIVCDFADQIFIYSNSEVMSGVARDSEISDWRKIDLGLNTVAGCLSALEFIRAPLKSFDIGIARARRWGAERIASSIRDIVDILEPAGVVVNNDVHPLAMMVEHAARSRGMPVVHSERSPLNTQWFEPEGFFARAQAWGVESAVWVGNSTYEEAGEPVLRSVAGNPSMHRGEASEGRVKRPKAVAADTSRPVFLIAMDHVINTGWVHPGHPKRRDNYPLFESPAEAVRHLQQIARAHGATLVLKPHPGDLYFNELIAFKGVERFEGPLEDALNMADVVFCFLTKVAFAAIARKKPVVTLAPNPAALSGLTFHCDTVEEIDAKVKAALAQEWTEADTARARQFFGWLDREYFVANDLSNPGAARMLDRFFPPRSEKDAAEPVSLDALFQVPGVLRPPREVDRAEAADILYGPFERDAGLRLDEVQLVLNLFKANHIAPDDEPGIMVDVGACVGGSFAEFASRGWEVHAFEPNPPMYMKILEKHQEPNIVVNQLAVSETTGDELPFYTSEESIGISSLLPFRDSHEPTATAKTIRLDDYVEQNNLERIDFLKIDTEGFDLMALKSHDWSRIRPKVIICEFEDIKTEKLGYSVEDTAKFLLDRGYTLYVSEWSPITRYGGVNHRWRALRRWRPKSLPADAWGNLIALREPVSDQTIADLTWNTIHLHKTRIAQRAVRVHPNRQGGQDGDAPAAALARTFPVDLAATLVVLGNGPSLKGFDFKRLDRLDCIGMNAAYRYWHEIGWYPRYYACFDLVVGLSHRDAIADLIRKSDENGIELFVLRRNLINTLPDDVACRGKILDFDALMGLDGMAAEPLTTGSHAALLGAYLGYGKLALLGVDCTYVEKIEGAEEKEDVVLELAGMPADNPNYFFSGYQQPGDRYQVPNPVPDLHLKSWRAVAPYFKRHGVKVWNCSPVSRVDAFYFRHFDDIETEHLQEGTPARALKIDRGSFPAYAIK